MQVPAGLPDIPGSNIDPIVAFDLDEHHPNWLVLAPILEKWGALGVSHTEFSKEEISSARWLEIRCNQHGYPEPDDDFGYLQATFDLTDWCHQCYTGMKQDRPFQMKREPKVGRNGIWVLNDN